MPSSIKERSSADKQVEDDYDEFYETLDSSLAQQMKYFTDEYDREDGCVPDVEEYVPQLSSNKPRSWELVKVEITEGPVHESLRQERNHSIKVVRNEVKQIPTERFSKILTEKENKSSCMREATAAVAPNKRRRVRRRFLEVINGQLMRVTVTPKGKRTEKPAKKYNN